MLSEIDVSYHTSERLFSDDEVTIPIHDLNMTIMSRNGLPKSDATGKGTGYSMILKKNTNTIETLQSIWL